MSWQDDKRRADRFLPEIKQILGFYLIGEPPQEEDMHRNTDLIVLRMEAVRIGCRIRTYDYFVRYPEDFTIRAERPNGTKTELTKIIEGWGRYFFYGFSDEHETRLAYWTLADLNAFRLIFNRRCLQGKMPGIHLSNHDGSSDFRAFHWWEFPGMVVANTDNYCSKTPLPSPGMFRTQLDFNHCQACGQSVKPLEI